FRSQVDSNTPALSARQRCLSQRGVAVYFSSTTGERSPKSTDCPGALRRAVKRLDYFMANQRYEVKHPRKYVDRDGNERTYWTKCGSAWQREQGGFTIELDYVPVAVDAESGKLKFIAFEQEAREDQ